MNYVPHGKHLIAGAWVATAETFASDPAHGPAHQFSTGTVDLVNTACAAAEAAFLAYSQTSRVERARFLEEIAEQIDARAEAITMIGTQETGLPAARLQGERGRTTGQLRLFAQHIRAGDYLDRRVDLALPERQPAPRPEIRMMQRPLGPVAVFGASNFPLAFSTAGGDTASALAAGCPVVVRGHPAHPGTGEIIAEAILAAIQACHIPPAVFSLIQGGHHEVGTALVTNPFMKAVGFTGSLTGGRALFDLCAARPEPIPFFGELGSINPMFILPGALSERGSGIASGWAGSLTMGAGQFCTNPGVAIVMADQAEGFAQATLAELAKMGSQVMLTRGIARAFDDGRARIAGQPTVESLLDQPCEGRDSKPQLFMVKGEDWRKNNILSQEVFGALGLIVQVASFEEMEAVAQTLEGQLTATLHLNDADLPLARRLMPELERKAGRILANGFPTGVEVCDAMVHGGPYPASTNFGATSVGTMAIRRWLRPVALQNMPDALLDGDWRG